MIKYAAFIILGILLITLGITNCRGNISTIHWYNRRKVSPADIPKYGKYMGIGTIIFGCTLLITVLLEAITHNPAVELSVLIGFAIGLVFILYAQFKYNKGLF